MALINKILIVDDSTTNIFLLENLLRPYGYEIYTALNGRDALNLVSKIKFDLVLLDIMMPEMSGIEVLKNILHNMQVKNIKVIMVTARTAPENIDEAMEYGAVDYITKPIESESFIKTIQKHLS